MWRLTSEVGLGAPLARATPRSSPSYSVCTIVTRPAEYAQMRESFVRMGFSLEDTQYLWFDNSGGNGVEAFEAYNVFLQEARGSHIILCHQDVLLLADGRPELDRIIADLDARDPFWGVCGNAGAKADGDLAIRITDPHGRDQAKGGPFPARTVSLDENFIVARRDANLAVSRDLKGFHLYGADLCIVAAILGFNAYVVDFHLLHKSGGQVDASYEEVRSALVRKYRRALAPRWVHVTTWRSVHLSGSAAVSLAARLRRRLGRLVRSR